MPQLLIFKESLIGFDKLKFWQKSRHFFRKLNLRILDNFISLQGVAQRCAFCFISFLLFGLGLCFEGPIFLVNPDNVLCSRVIDREFDGCFFYWKALVEDFLDELFSFVYLDLLVTLLLYDDVGDVGRHYCILRVELNLRGLDHHSCKWIVVVLDLVVFNFLEVLNHCLSINL